MLEGHEMKLESMPHPACDHNQSAMHHYAENSQTRFSSGDRGSSQTRQTQVWFVSPEVGMFVNTPSFQVTG